MKLSKYNQSGELAPSELILNADGSVYHLGLKNEHVKDDVIVVGDMARVDLIAKHFDRTIATIQNRECMAARRLR